MHAAFRVFAVVLALLLENPPRLNETIVVTAERLEQPRQESTAAVTVLRRQDLAALPAKNLGDALRLVPGLQLVSVNPGAPPMISSRGFFGAGEVEYVQLLVDGVPVGDVESGLADWRSIPIESVDRIEIVRGAGSSLFGDTALGGVVQVFRRPISHVSLSHSSFESTRWSAAYAGESLTFTATGTQGGGFRRHSSHREVAGSAAFTRGPWRASIDLSDRDREDPGPRGEEELFRFDGEETRRVRTSMRYEGAVAVSAHLQDRHTENVRTFLLAPGFGDRAARELDTFALGAGIVKSAAFRSGRIAGGIDVERDTMQSTYFAFEQSRGRRLADGSGSRLRSAAFLTGEWRVMPSLRLAMGGRWDRIADRFESTDGGRLARTRRASRPATHHDETQSGGTPDCCGRDARRPINEQAFSPRIGISFNLGSSTTSYVQLSRAFKAPTLDQRFDQRPFPDFAGGTFTISNPGLVAQRANNIEAGVRGAGVTYEWELIGYASEVDDEIDFDVRTFRYANIGRSRHRGIEAIVGGDPRGWIAPRLTYTWTRVEPVEGSNRGRQLKNIAEHVVRGDLALRTMVDVHIAVEHAAGRWLDDANAFPLDDATVVDVRLSRTIGVLNLSIETLNLFDADYAPLGFALSDVPFYFPAAGRSVGVTLSWRESP